MKPKDFLTQLADETIVAAIQKAEARTSGEIRVFVSHHKVVDPLAAAQKQFRRLRMEWTRDRNAVLIFVAPVSHKFAIIGDVAIHARCCQGFWDDLAAAMAGHFRHNQWTAGIVVAIERAAELLAQHFPRRAGDHNELPDKIERD